MQWEEVQIKLNFSWKLSPSLTHLLIQDDPQLQVPTITNIAAKSFLYLFMCFF